MTFVPNHGNAVVARDFFVVMEVGTLRIVRHNLTAHPTAEWTLRQSREALPGGHTYRLVIRDRDRIWSKDLDQAVEAMGVRVLRTPASTPEEIFVEYNHKYKHVQDRCPAAAVLDGHFL